ncbi:MAG: hypothetical protein ACYSWX_12210 [Planctomycetota bacterium]|jgi:hypothetical protein
MRSIFVGLAGLALATPVFAQSNNSPNFTVGPELSPLGSPIYITFSNDTPGQFGTLNCPFAVYDDAQQLVFEPSCSGQVFDLLPGGYLYWTWNQIDLAGNQVPAGRYWIETEFEGGSSQLHPVDLGATDAGVVLLGTASEFDLFNGEHRPFFLTSPQDPGAHYWLLASFATTPGLATCGGTLPLAVDPLFELTIQSDNGILIGNQGVLDGSGRSSSTRLNVPNVPALVGTEFSVAFATLDFQDPACLVRRTSAAHTMRILP